MSNASLDAAAGSRQALNEELAEALAEADLTGFFSILFSSGFPDGLVRRLQTRWPQPDAEDMVAQAVASLYRAVRDGQKVLDPLAYLVKAVKNIATGLWRERREHVEQPQDPDQLDMFAAGPADPDGEDVGRDERLASALRLARSFLPRLGHQNVQAVMGYIFDAVEAGRVDVPNDEIAEALDLSSSSVRQCKSRGWKRLARAASEQGMHIEALEQEVDALENEAVAVDDDAGGRE